MLNLEPDTARFLYILLRSSRRTRILEIGTSNGYSTIWLAWAASAAGGHVISIDRDAHKQALAEANLLRAELREVVDLVCGDATEIVADLPGPFDCVFFDADRYSAPAQLNLAPPEIGTRCAPPRRQRPLAPRRDCGLLASAGITARLRPCRAPHRQRIEPGLPLGWRLERLIVGVQLE